MPDTTPPTRETTDRWLVRSLREVTRLRAEIGALTLDLADLRHEEVGIAAEGPHQTALWGRAEARRLAHLRVADRVALETVVPVDVRALSVTEEASLYAALSAQRAALLAALYCGERGHEHERQRLEAADALRLNQTRQQAAECEIASLEARLAELDVPPATTAHDAFAVFEVMAAHGSPLDRTYAGQDVARHLVYARRRDTPATAQATPRGARARGAGRPKASRPAASATGGGSSGDDGPAEPAPADPPADGGPRPDRSAK